MLKFVSPKSIVAFAVASLLLVSAGSSRAAEKVKPIRALLVLGGCCHDYNKIGRAHV